MRLVVLSGGLAVRAAGEIRGHSRVSGGVPNQTQHALEGKGTSIGSPEKEGQESSQMGAVQGEPC